MNRGAKRVSARVPQGGASADALALIYGPVLLRGDVVRRAGLPWPFFIVFDDVEYGLRLTRLGISSVTMPGIAVWHETGEDRDARWKTYYY